MNTNQDQKDLHNRATIGVETFRGKAVIKWALSLSIIVVLNLFFAVAIQTVYPAPEYTDFCVQEQVNRDFIDEVSCVASGGQWNEFTGPKTPGELDRDGWCNPNFTCQQNYDDARETYARNVFVALVVLGAFALGAGYMFRISPAVSAGLSYGGVLTFIIAAIQYWDAAGDVIRLTIIATALIALIVIGIKKFKE